MTRVAYLDLVGGAAGDMLLCALLDAGETLRPGAGSGGSSMSWRACRSRTAARGSKG